MSDKNDHVVLVDNDGKWLTVTKLDKGASPPAAPTGATSFVFTDAAGPALAVQRALAGHEKPIAIQGVVYEDKENKWVVFNNGRDVQLLRQGSSCCKFV